MKTATSKKNVAIGYIRVSTEEQAAEGVSLSAQEKAIRTYCELKGLILLKIVTDPGVSAGKALSKRTGGAEVLRAVATKEVDSVVVYKLDRLFRNCPDCLTVTEAWDRKGVSLHLIDLGGQSLDTSSAMGRFFLTVMAGAAELERNMIRERTTAALKHKKENGELVGSTPYGKQLCEDGCHLEVNHEEQKVVSLIRDLRNQGLSYQKIVNHLTTHGVPARGGKWHLNTVVRILKS
jgi:DNA invertase Pin-like site-specific DNA recombinase